MTVDVFCDGSATSVGKPGGYGYVVIIDGIKHSEGSGHVPSATNNDMEMKSAIEGLKAVIRLRIADPTLIDAKVTLVSDSQLVLGWASGRYRFKQVEKLPEYEKLKKCVERLQVDTRWVKSHAGDEHNERCDKLANAARLQIKIKEKSR